MRLTLIPGVVGIVAFSLPAFASTSEAGLREVSRTMLPSTYVQVATNAEEDGPLLAAMSIFERLGLEQGEDAIREGLYRGERLAEIGNPNVPEGEADDNFRCAVMGATGVPIKCVRYLP